MERKRGFYWIVFSDKRMVGEWNGRDWMLPGINERFNDNELDEINENKLKYE